MGRTLDVPWGWEGPYQQTTNSLYIKSSGQWEQEHISNLWPICSWQILGLGVKGTWLKTNNVHEKDLGLFDTRIPLNWRTQETTWAAYCRTVEVFTQPFSLARITHHPKSAYATNLDLQLWPRANQGARLPWKFVGLNTWFLQNGKSHDLPEGHLVTIVQFHPMISLKVIWSPESNSIPKVIW